MVDGEKRTAMVPLADMLNHFRPRSEYMCHCTSFWTKCHNPACICARSFILQTYINALHVSCFKMHPLKTHSLIVAYPYCWLCENKAHTLLSGLHLFIPSLTPPPINRETSWTFDDKLRGFTISTLRDILCGAQVQGNLHVCTHRNVLIILRFAISIRLWTATAKNATVNFYSTMGTLKIVCLADNKAGVKILHGPDFYLTAHTFLLIYKCGGEDPSIITPFYAWLVRFAAGLLWKIIGKPTGNVLTRCMTYV